MKGDVFQLLNSVPNLDLFKLSLERKPNEGRALWEAILELKYVDRYGEYHGGKFDIIGYGRYALLTDGTIVKDSRYFIEIGENNGVKLYSRRFTKIEEES